MHSKHQLIIDRANDEKVKHDQKYNKQKELSCRVLTEKIRNIVNNPDESMLGFTANISSVKIMVDPDYHYNQPYFFKSADDGYPSKQIGDTKFYYTGCNEFAKLVKEINKFHNVIICSNKKWHNVDKWSMALSDNKIKYELHNSKRDTTNYDTDNKPKNWEQNIKN